MAAQVDRRQVLTGLIGVGAAGVLGGCARPSEPAADPSALASLVASAEAGRPTTGAVRRYTLTAQPVQVDLAGRVVTTWAYGDGVPGTPLRATAGDRVEVEVRNGLPEATSVHWHGLAIRNDMDGVPGVTTPEIPAGGSFGYGFVVPDAGTHWFHPHHGMQLDHGLYSSFVVEDPAEPGHYDLEWIVVLDDWTDGVGRSPEEILEGLVAAGQDGRGGMGMGMGGMGGMDGGDVEYPLYLVNGRPPEDPDVLQATAGQRVRLRIINASADSIMDVALGGHVLRITHSDGYAVVPVDAEALRLGMGERYDAVVELRDGVFPLVAQPVGKRGLARALVRTAPGAAPSSTYRPRELDAEPSTVGALEAAPGTALPSREPDVVHPVVLSGSMAPYVWTINGRTYDDAEPLTIASGQSGRLRIVNRSMMPHPVHLHGHTFQVGGAGGAGPRKDTVLLPAMAGVDVDLVADNPGRWMLHCHNAYHAEAGMMTLLDYTA